MKDLTMPKYIIGQAVWTLGYGKAEEKIVCGITCDKKQCQYIVRTEKELRTFNAGKTAYISYPESFLFPTKQDLIDSL